MTESIYLNYLAINETDLSWGTAVNSVGFIKDEDYSRKGLKLQRTSDFQLHYITDGKGFLSLLVDGKTKSISIKEGDMVIIFPDDSFALSPDKKAGWSRYLITFDGESVKAKVKSGFFPEDKHVLCVGTRDDICQQFRKAIDLAKEQKSAFQQRLASIVENLLSEAYFQDRNNSFKSTGIQKSITAAREIISRRYSTISPQEVAQELGMSYSNFRKIFKLYTGFSPAQYILDVRMNHVKEILSTTDMTIKDISVQEGFDNYEYFLTAFKANAGMSPSQYRSNTRK